jgi:prepilin-type N-terminal cleavage/methylation domain-containing protein
VSNPAPYGKRSREGFTLVEVIAVVIILSVLSSAVVPMFSGSMRNLRRTSSLDHVENMIKFAHERAIMGGVEHRFYMDVDKSMYWVAYLDGFDSQSTKIFLPLAERFGEVQLLPDGMTFERPKARQDRQLNAYFVAFYGSGACDDARVTVHDTIRNKTITIETNGRLGQFDIEGRDE